jgi:hypothetical protein
MFSAIGRPEVDADQIGKKLPNPGAAHANTRRCSECDVEQNGCWLVKWL